MAGGPSDPITRGRAALVERAGSIPDVGVWRAAEYLAGKLGTEHCPDAVVELVRAGRIRWAGWYKKNRLVSGLDLEKFDDREALEEAIVLGRQVKADEVATILQVRPVDVTHLVDRGRLKPIDFYQGQWNSLVALYRYGDLQDLLSDGSYDWDGVRALPAGTRSPFAKLPLRKAKA